MGLMEGRVYDLEKASRRTARNGEKADSNGNEPSSRSRCGQPCSPWVSFCDRFNRLLESLFTFTGRIIALHPWMTIFACLIFVGTCSSGFIFMTVESRAEELFIPQNSKSLKDLDKASKYFTLKVRMETVLLESATRGKALSSKCFKEVLRIHEDVMSLDHLSDLCATMPGLKSNSTSSCLIVNPLEIFDFKEENLMNISEKVTRAERNITWRMRNGLPVVYNMGRIFASVTREKGAILDVGALQMTYYIRDPESDEEFNEVIDWERSFIDKVSSHEGKMSCWNIFYSAGRSLDDAISESTGADMLLVSITFALMISFACTMLGKFRNPLTGHSLLANAGVLAVALGIVAGFGLAMMTGAKFISMVGILPFLVIGIGIDDIFIIVDELDRHKPQDVAETIKVVMSNSGATITMTTVTDLVAFAVSTATSFPAIRYFCIYAALSVTFAYLMIVTFFVAIMTFDVKRIKLGLRDCLPVCRAPPTKEGQPAWDEPRTQTSNKMMQAWAGFLMLPGVKAIVVVISCGLLGFGVYGSMNIDQQFDRRVMAKDDSYLIKFLNTEEKYFGLSLPVSVVWTGNIPYADTATQDEMKKVSEIIKSSKFYHNRTRSWLEAFLEFTVKSGIKTESEVQFMSALRSFLETPHYAFFGNDIKLSKDRQAIVASRIVGSMESSGSSSFQRDAMVTLREDIAKYSKLGAFPIAKPFIYLEQYVIILSSTIRNLAIAAGAILVLTSPFLVDLTVILLVFLNFVALIFELFGLMYVWGVSLNAVAMVNLVMAIGFAVDYSAHIAHAFVTSAKEVANERVIEALSTLGASVLMGGLSTFIGMVVTAFASSEIFRIFFRMFFGIVVFGLLHGLCFLPVYLSFIWWRPTVSSSPSTHLVELESRPESEKKDATTALSNAAFQDDEGVASGTVTSKATDKTASPTESPYGSLQLRTEDD